MALALRHPALLVIGMAVGCGSTTSGASLRNEEAIAETIEERFPWRCISHDGHIVPDQDTIVVHVTVAPNGALTLRDLSDCASVHVSFECVRDHFSRKHIRGVADHTLDVDLVITDAHPLGDNTRPRVFTRKSFEKQFGKPHTTQCRAKW